MSDVYGLTYACGHEDSVVLFGSKDRHPSIVAYYSHCLCPKCENDRRNAKREVLYDCVMGAMRGADDVQIASNNEEQIEWAEGIRSKFLSKTFGDT